MWNCSQNRIGFLTGSILVFENVKLYSTNLVSLHRVTALISQSTEQTLCNVRRSIQMKENIISDSACSRAGSASVAFKLITLRLWSCFNCSRYPQCGVVACILCSCRLRLTRKAIQRIFTANEQFSKSCSRKVPSVPPDHLLLDSAPNLGPLVSCWELDKFKMKCWNKTVRAFKFLTLMYQQFSNLFIF